MQDHYRFWFSISVGLVVLTQSASFSVAQTGTTQTSRTLYATVTDPSVGQLMSVANPDPVDTTDDFYKARSKIGGIAERNKPVSLYVFAKVPELISNFQAVADAGSSALTLSWTPRQVFNACSGEGCNNGAYYGIVRPGETFDLTTFPGVNALLPILPSGPPAGLNNCTSGNVCRNSEGGGTCQYHWQYNLEWMNENDKPVDPHSISETEKTDHTYTVRLKTIITSEWIAPVTFCGPECSPGGSFPFGFIDSVYATPAAGGGGSEPPTTGGGSSSGGILPTCSLAGSTTSQSASFQVLVDDFDRYQIAYGEVTDPSGATASQSNAVLPDRGLSYYNNSKVTDTEAPGWSAKSINPLTSSVTLNFDATKTYRLALFELRRQSDYNLTPHSNVVSETTAYAPNADASVGPPDTSGYLFVAKNTAGGNELQIGPGGITAPTPTDTKEKVELELVSTLNANKDERFSKDIYTMSLNPYARTHFVAATYSATDVATPNIEDPKNLRISTTSRLSFFNLNDIGAGLWILNPNISYANTSPNPYGVVYDSWTGEPLGSSTISVHGNSGSLGEGVISYDYTQITNEDGLYSLYLNKGDYTLKIENIQGVSNNFKFPVNNCSTFTLAPYKDNYCGGTIKITDNKPAHYDVPVAPLLYGTAPANAAIILKNTATQKNYGTIALPNGKYSFFVPAGNYQIIVNGQSSGSITITSVPQQKDL